MVESSAQPKHARRQTLDEKLTEQGIVIDILSRLPVKSLCSFKTVCKSWHGLLRNKYFAKKHFSRSKENPTFISCPSMDTTMELYSMNPETLQLTSFNTINPSLNTINPAERSHEDYMYMISSFNGLICCINQISDEDEENGFYDLQIWIRNPCTDETLLLPQGTPSFEVEPSVGVAYASDTSDYKVFRIFCAGKKFPEGRVSAEYVFRGGRFFIRYRYALVYECEVFSSSTGSWKNIGPVPCAPMRSALSPFRSSHVCVGGKVFWLVSLDGEGEILSVDLEGRFEVNKLPAYESAMRADDKITEGSYLINLQGSLSLVILHPQDMDVWVWKDEGDEFRWVKVCEINTPFDYYDIVLAMTSSKNQILCVTETHYWACNVDTGDWNGVLAHPSVFVNPSVFPFTESVLTCNGGIML